MSKWNIAESVFFLIFSVIAIMFFEDWRRPGTVLLVLSIISLAIKLWIAKRAAQ